MSRLYDGLNYASGFPKDAIGKIGDGVWRELGIRGAYPGIVEHYRKLRTKTISPIVTSPGPQEVQTVTVLNLASSLAMLPRFRVRMVDGDGSVPVELNWQGFERRFNRISDTTGTVEAG